MAPTRKTQALRIALPLGVLAILIGAILVSRGDGSGADPRAGVRWLYPSEPIPGVSRRLLGNGPRAAVILWRKGSRPPPEAVVFLHGWLPKPPIAYGAWLRHLAEAGNTIVYPVYQGLLTKPEKLLGNAIAGIAAGLRAVRADPDSVVAVGDTTGGALAFDYAAVAADRGLPGPRAVLAAFPGRNPGRGEVTPADLSRIPPQTQLAVIAGPGDPIPDGEAQAQALLRGATGVPSELRRYLSAPRDTGPRGEGRPSRRAFWAPLDRMIAAARGAPTPP